MVDSRLSRGQRAADKSVLKFRVRPNFIPWRRNFLIRYFSANLSRGCKLYDYYVEFKLHAPLERKNFASKL